MTPFAKIDGFASVSIDFIILEIGVKAVLTLIDASLPVTGTLSLGGETIDDLSFKFAIDADLKLQMLDGYLALFGKIGVWIFSTSFEVKIFSWKGIEHVIPILHEEIELIDVNAIKRLLDI